jgi:hypothetical protein
MKRKIFSLFSTENSNNKKGKILKGPCVTVPQSFPSSSEKRLVDNFCNRSTKRTIR